MKIINLYWLWQKSKSKIIKYGVRLGALISKRTPKTHFLAELATNCLKLKKEWVTTVLIWSSNKKYKLHSTGLIFLRKCLVTYWFLNWIIYILVWVPNTTETWYLKLEKEQADLEVFSFSPMITSLSSKLWPQVSWLCF